jgi:hypothetical protein
MVNYIFNNNFVEIEPFRRRGGGILGNIKKAVNKVIPTKRPPAQAPPAEAPPAEAPPAEAPPAEAPPAEAPPAAAPAPPAPPAPAPPAPAPPAQPAQASCGQNVSVMSMNPIKKTFALTGFDATNVYCLLNPDFTFCSSTASDVMDLTQFKVSSTQTYNQIFPNNETQVSWCKMKCLADQNCYAILSTFNATTNSCTFYTA